MSKKKKFGQILEQEGLMRAIRWLNQQTPYRYTAIFAFAGDTLRNIVLIDKENAEITDCPDCPVTSSYCTYIRQSGRQFNVETSLTDPRVENHPKRTVFQCYYGVPLYDRDRRLLGTICHFDPAPIQVTDEVATLLDDLAPLIAEKTFEK